MKIIAIEHEIKGADTSGFAAHGKAEAQQVWQLYLEGIIREPYFRQGKNEAVLILECDSIDQAQNYLATLPFVREKLIRFELIPLSPYPGFSRLFKSL